MSKSPFASTKRNSSGISKPLWKRSSRLPDPRGKRRMHSDGAGIFLIHLDGTVTTSAALAALAAEPSPAAHGRVRPALGAALGLTSDQESGFLRWLELARKRHRDLRWEKIVQ